MCQNLIWFAILFVSGQTQQLYNFDDHYNNFPRTHQVRHNLEQQWPVDQYFQHDRMSLDSDKNIFCQNRRFQTDTMPYVLPHTKLLKPAPRVNMNVEVIKNIAGISQSQTSTLGIVNPFLVNYNNVKPLSDDCVPQSVTEPKLTPEIKEKKSLTTFNDEDGIYKQMENNFNDRVLLNNDVKCLTNDNKVEIGSTRRFITDDMPLVAYKGNKNELSTNTEEPSENNNNNFIEHIIVKEHDYNLGNSWNEGNEKLNIPIKSSSNDGKNKKNIAKSHFQETENENSVSVNKKIDTRKYNENVPAVQKRLTKIEDQLIEPAKVYDISTSFDTSVVLLEHTRVCYACSSIGDSSCWLPDRRTTVKYCRKGHDSCVTKTYKSTEGNFIVMRDCSSSCDIILPILNSNYKSCSLCNTDLCNDNYIDSNAGHTNTQNVLFILFATIFSKLLICY